MTEDTPLSLASEGSMLRLKATGEWVAREASRLEPLAGKVPQEIEGATKVEMDLTGVTRLDTLGAMLLDQARTSLQARGVAVDLTTADEAQRVLMEEVASYGKATEPPRTRTLSLVDLLAEIGATIRSMGRDVIGMNAFLGDLVLTIGGLFVGHARLRVPAIVTQLERMAFRGVPIITLIAFLVGCIIAQQTIFQLERFGATLFVVDLLGILMLREVGLLLAAIDVEIEPVEDEPVAKADLHPSSLDDRLPLVSHRQYRIDAKKRAKMPSTTMTVKIDLTTDAVVWRPSDSADPSTFMPSMQAMRPIISAMTGALRMPTKKVLRPIASLSRLTKVAGVTPP